MKLNLAEKLLVNNPARALVQRFYEGPLLKELGGRLDNARVLEAGCGQGVCRSYWSSSVQAKSAEST